MRRSRLPPCLRGRSAVIWRRVPVAVHSPAAASLGGQKISRLVPSIEVRNQETETVAMNGSGALPTYSRLFSPTATKWPDRNSASRPLSQSAVERFIEIQSLAFLAMQAQLTDELFVGRTRMG